MWATQPCPVADSCWASFVLSASLVQRVHNPCRMHDVTVSSLATECAMTHATVETTLLHIPCVRIRRGMQEAVSGVGMHRCMRVNDHAGSMLAHSMTNVCGPGAQLSASKQCCAPILHREAARASQRGWRESKPLESALSAQRSVRPAAAHSSDRSKCNA